MTQQQINDLIELHVKYCGQSEAAFEQAEKFEEAAAAIETILAVEGVALTSAAPTPEPEKRPELMPAVRTALAAMPGHFTVREMTAELAKADPAFGTDDRQASVSSALRRLAESGEINVVTRGAGKRATVFTKMALEPETLLKSA